MTTATTALPHRNPGRMFLALGFGLAALGIACYIAQVQVGHLKRPWYLPLSAMLGVVCLVVSLWKRRSVWRVLSLILLVLLAGAEWGFLLGSRLPSYTGTQVAVGKSFPAFATVKADGVPFTQRDLEGDRDTVMVFFRGRW